MAGTGSSKSDMPPLADDDGDEQQTTYEPVPIPPMGTHRRRMADLGKLTKDHIYIGTGSVRFGQKPNRWTFHDTIKDGETPQEFHLRYRNYLNKKPELMKDIHLLKGKTPVKAID